MIELLLYSIIWAVWRRVFGGWLNLSRYTTVIVGFFLGSIPFLQFGYPIAAIAGGLSMLFWTPGHDFRSNYKLWRRYTYIGIPWMLLEKYEGKRPLNMGWTELSEIGAGALFGITLYLIVKLVELVLGL